MRYFPHPVGCQEVHWRFDRARSHIVRMQTQFSSVANSLLFLPIFNFPEYFSCTMASVTLKSRWKRVRHMYSPETPSERDHRFEGLCHVPFSVKHRFFRCELDSLMIHQETKLGLIQSHDFVPAVGFVCLKRSQQLSKQVGPDRLLIA